MAIAAIDVTKKAEVAVAAIDGTSVAEGVVCLLWYPELGGKWHLPNAQCMSVNCLEVW